VVPAFTVSVCGPKVKLSIDTELVGPSARVNNTLAARSDPTAAEHVEAITGRNIFVFLSFAAPPPWQDKAADRAALSLNAGRR
jgi:hypothetical protein